MNTKGYSGVFVSDLDGTLLNDSKKISLQDHRALATLGDKQILRIIATGRSLYSTRACLPENFPVDYLIASTGSHVLEWTTGKVLKAATLSPDDTKTISKFLLDLNVNFMIHDSFPDNQSFAYHRSHTYNEDFERRLNLYPAWGREFIAGQKSDAASQILVVLQAHQLDVYAHIVQAYAHLSVIRATSPLDDQSLWIEIFAPQVSKAHGILHILTHHGLDHVLTAAIGNDHNDQDMLNLVHLPYVVENAFLTYSPKYHRTPDNNNSAVAYAIEHFTNVLFGVTNT